MNNIADDLHDAYEEGYKDGMRDAKKHGYWEEEEIKQGENGRCVIKDWQSAKCSKCGKWHTTPYMYYFDYYNYCPNCGARMDEVTE